MKSEGRGSKSPLTGQLPALAQQQVRVSRAVRRHRRAGRRLVHRQFQALFFLTGPLKLDWQAAYLLIGLSLVIGTPFFLVFGRLSDKIDG